MSLSDLGSSGASSVNSFFNQPAENYGNDEAVEYQWAMKAFHHAETYFNGRLVLGQKKASDITGMLTTESPELVNKLIKSVDPKLLKLTKADDEIYKDFRENFADLKIDEVDENLIKSDIEKSKWREFCNRYQGKVEDFSMGSLLRLKSADDVNDSNTTLVPRIQFLAIEIARNREGFNDGLREKYRKT